MRRAATLILGSTSSLAAGCWSGGGGSPPPAAPAGGSNGAVVVAPAETVVARDEDDPARAREQAIAQARAAGVLDAVNRAGSGSGGTPVVTLAPPTAGTVDKESIRRAIRGHLPKIQQCYEQRLLQDPSLQGTTTVKFVIGPTGAVLSAAGTGFDPDVDTCVAVVMEQVVFPPPAGGGQVHVNYPFKFRPAGP